MPRDDLQARADALNGAYKHHSAHAVLERALKKSKALASKGVTLLAGESLGAAWRLGETHKTFSSEP